MLKAPLILLGGKLSFFTKSTYFFYRGLSYRYTDGTGGCDGCLDWEGMGISYQKKGESSGNGPYDKTFDDPGDITNGKGDNNGLAMTVLALEHVFKDSKAWGQRSESDGSREV